MGAPWGTCWGNGKATSWLWQASVSGPDDPGQHGFPSVPFGHKTYHTRRLIRPVLGARFFPWARSDGPRPHGSGFEAGATAPLPRVPGYLPRSRSNRTLSREIRREAPLPEGAGPAHAARGEIGEAQTAGCVATAG